MTQPPANDSLSPETESLLRAIAEKRASDPLIGAKIGAMEINNRLIAVLKNERGVHIESLLSILAALAGYACQASARAQLVETGKMTEAELFIIAEDEDGNRYFFGDAINAYLAESAYSVWSLTAGAVQALGGILPDLDPIFEHVAASVGSDAFGIPRIPAGHAVAERPIDSLRLIWPALKPTIDLFSQTPADWPIILGMCIYNVINMGKDALDPSIAATIVMETAIPMSKVDLQPSGAKQ